MIRNCHCADGRHKKKTTGLPRQDIKKKSEKKGITIKWEKSECMKKELDCSWKILCLLNVTIECKARERGNPYLILFKFTFWGWYCDV